MISNRKSCLSPNLKDTNQHFIVIPIHCLAFWPGVWKTMPGSTSNTYYARLSSLFGARGTSLGIKHFL